MIANFTVYTLAVGGLGTELEDKLTSSQYGFNDELLEMGAPIGQWDSVLFLFVGESVRVFIRTQGSFILLGGSYCCSVGVQLCVE